MAETRPGRIWRFRIRTAMGGGLEAETGRLVLFHALLRLQFKLDLKFHHDLLNLRGCSHAPIYFHFVEAAGVFFDLISDFIESGDGISVRNVCKQFVGLARGAGLTKNVEACENFINNPLSIDQFKEMQDLLQDLSYDFLEINEHLLNQRLCVELEGFCVFGPSSLCPRLLSAAPHASNPTPSIPKSPPTRTVLPFLKTNGELKKLENKNSREEIVRDEVDEYNSLTESGSISVMHPISDATLRPPVKNSTKNGESSIKEEDSCIEKEVNGSGLFDKTPSHGESPIKKEEDSCIEEDVSGSPLFDKTPKKGAIVKKFRIKLMCFHFCYGE